MKLTDEQRAKRNRLKTWMKLQRIKRQDLADKTGFQKNYIDQVLSGSNGVSKSLVFEISKHYKNVNTDWIMEGKEPMLLTEIWVVEEPSAPYGPESKEDLFGDLRALLEHYRYRIEGLEEAVRVLQGEVAALRKGK